MWTPWNWLYHFFKKKSRPMFGIDISHHQGAVDFAEMRNNNPKVDFIYMKATQGVGYVDPKVRVNSVEAKQFGFPIGYYHFCTLNDTNVIADSTKEAMHFISTVKTLPSPDLPLVLDIEHEDPKIQLPDDKVLLWIKTFFETLRISGYNDCVLYSYTPVPQFPPTIGS